MFLPRLKKCTEQYSNTMMLQYYHDFHREWKTINDMYSENEYSGRFEITRILVRQVSATVTRSINAVKNIGI